MMSNKKRVSLSVLLQLIRNEDIIMHAYINQLWMEFKHSSMKYLFGMHVR